MQLRHPSAAELAWKLPAEQLEHAVLATVDEYWPEGHDKQDVEPTAEP